MNGGCHMWNGAGARSRVRGNRCRSGRGRSVWTIGGHPGCPFSCPPGRLIPQIHFVCHLNASIRDYAAMRAAVRKTNHDQSSSICYLDNGIVRAEESYVL